MTALFKKPGGGESALDLVASDTQGNLLRLGIPDVANPGQIVYGAYVNAAGHAFSCLSLVISGVYTRQKNPDGSTSLRIYNPSERLPGMLGIWNDVSHSIVARSFNAPAEQSYFLRTLDYGPPGKPEKEVERFAIRMDGRLEWRRGQEAKPNAILGSGEGPPTDDCDAGLYLQWNGDIWRRKDGKWRRLKFEEEA